MITRPILLISALCSFYALRAQTVSHVYKIDDLLTRINQKDTTYIVNFWATWCKPCVQELPSFDSLYAAAPAKGAKIKIILVSLDFKEDIDKKVNPFLAKNAIKAECVLLDEINGNDFVNKISPQWSGAIPATLIKAGTKKELFEKRLTLLQLQENVSQVR
jgi:thiol-disulfide isomerase/thioredoxin